MTDPATTVPSLNAARLLENWQAVCARIAQAAETSGRSSNAVRLIAVTKRTPHAWSRHLVQFGQCDLGENYPQELWDKADALSDLPMTWHHIGHLQSNKARRTLEVVTWIHGVDSLKLLDRLITLAAERPQRPLRLLLQVNTSGETAKHGWNPDDLIAEAESIAERAERIPIAGLMTIAGYGTDDETARPMFARLRQLRDQLRQRTGLPWNELSMGMSGDFEAGIAEGASMVRVGSALFDGVAEESV